MRDIPQQSLLSLRLLRAIQIRANHPEKFLRVFETLENKEGMLAGDRHS